MNYLSSNFNVVDFMNLNPELSVYLNINTVEDATDWYSNYSNLHLATSMHELPSTFNPNIFISSSRDIANISSLSRDIKESMIRQGILLSQISRKQSYVANIYQPVTYIEPNCFYIESSFATNSNALLIDDNIRVLDPQSTELLFQVSNITSNMITVYPNTNQLYNTSNYMLYGIQATDFHLIAQINHFRLVLGYSNLNSNGEVVSAVLNSNTNYLSSSTDNSFNSDLYKLLYKNARGMTELQSFQDWTNNRKNEIYRIRNVKDIAFGDGNEYVNFNYLRMSCNMLIKGVSIDGISSNLDASLSNIPGDPNKLITTYAIKDYCDVRLADILNMGVFNNIITTNSFTASNTVIMTSDVDVFGGINVNSNSIFSNNVHIAGNQIVNSNLDVSGNVVLRNSLMLTNGNATFSNNVLVNGSMSVTGNIYNARIGLGYVNDYLNSNIGIDIIHAQNYNDNSDERIKKDITYISPKTCLDKLSQINIARFTYNYGLPHKDKVTTGCIAQQLKSVGLDEYIYTTPGYVPNIMEKCTIYQNILTMENDIHIETNTNIKLIHRVNNTEHIVKILKKIERYIFQIDKPISSLNTIDQYTMYGYQTDALFNVDYKQLFVLAIGAIQELNNIVVK